MRNEKNILLMIMNRVKSILFICIVLLSMQIQTATAHSGKPKYHIIIDSDGAVDDMRAITMFLACDDVRVLGITGSQGSVKPYSAAIKINSLLSDFHHQGIPVGVGKTVNSDLPAWNSFSESIHWGDNIPDRSVQFPKAIDLMNNIVEDYPEKIILIALGGFTNYAEWLKNKPENIQKIERIIWYNDMDTEQGFNYQIDKNSFDFIKTLNIPIQIVSNTRSDLICDTTFLNNLQKVNSIYAKQIVSVHKQAQASEKVLQNHLLLWDDLLPVFLSCPIIFNTGEQKDNITYVNLEKQIPKDFITEMITTLLISGTETHNRVFQEFPVDTMLYKKPVAKIQARTIEDYGLIEWKATVLTNEIHGHTGIYSIIGVKMGIRACEYFNVGINNLHVISFAGKKPPSSCLNDGIQISTGATIGQGLIEISDTICTIPTAIFEFNNKRITIKLKEVEAQKIQEDIKKGVQLYSFSEQYWLYIEELALQYWANYDRHAIFEIEKL